MLKNLKIVLAFVLAISLSTTVTLNAEENTDVKSVETYAALKEAAADKTVTSIKLIADITVEEPVLFLHDVEIDGNNHTLTAVKKKAEWEGLYILKFHRINASLTDITLDGGDAAILVNNSSLTLSGNVSLKNQVFGGIELTQGKTANTSPVKLVTSANITNTGEEKGKPTIWTDMIANYEFEASNFVKRDDIKENQIHYYLVDPDIEQATKVTTMQEFKDALAAKKTIISIENDLEFTEKVNVTYPVSIEGNGHTIKGIDTEGWNGFYLLQFFKTEATLSNITLTGADAAILVNGSTLTLVGEIDVSGNEFGGIELSKGKNVTTDLKLDASEASLSNATEDYGLPTLWIDGDVDVEVIYDGLVIRNDVVLTQTQYYLNKVTNREQIVTDIALAVFEDLELEGFEVEIDQEARSIILRKVEEGATISEDEIVETLVAAIMSNEDIKGFVLDGEAHYDYDEEYVDTVVRRMITVLKENQDQAFSSFNDLQVALRFHVAYDNQVIPTEDLDVTYTETANNENPVVEPEKPVDKGTDKKDDTKKTPSTGIQDEAYIYMTLIVAAALILVVTRYKKRYH